MTNLQFQEGSKELLDLLKPLWELLNQYHYEQTVYFQDKFRGLTFEERKRKFHGNPGVKVRVDLVKDVQIDDYIGYCISTVNESSIGEVDSLYIKKEYRKYGLGDQLMNRALLWLEEHRVKSKKIGIVAGNDNVLDFYRRHNFQVSQIIMEEVPRSKG